MKRYDTYTDSDISWIGKIPSHWEMRRVKSLLSTTYSGEWGNEPTPDNAYVCVRVADFNFNSNVVEFIDLPTHRSYSTKDIQEKQLQNSDILLEKSGGGDKTPVGRVVLWSKDEGASPFMCANFIQVLRPKTNEVSPKYLLLLLSTLHNKDGIRLFVRQTTGIQNLTLRSYLAQSLYLPPQEEQEAIVAYLDEKCAQIDRYVASLEERIERLGELRHALIAEAVTRGINPQAPLRPSGIPWLGEIPQHWEMKRLKYLFSERSEKGFPDEPILCSTQKYGVIPQSMYENRVVVVNKGLEGLKLVRKGDFVISLRSFQGGIEYAHYQGIISAAYTILQLNEGANSAYLRYLLKSQPFIQLLQVCVIGIREGQNINYSLLRKNFLPVPPQEEQEAIVAYLDEKTTQIDRYTGQIEEMIRQMRDLRQTIISEAVTGKICVLPN